MECGAIFKSVRFCAGIGFGVGSNYAIKVTLPGRLRFTRAGTYKGMYAMSQRENRMISTGFRPPFVQRRAFQIENK
jgi:hypothetical protein